MKNLLAFSNTKKYITAIKAANLIRNGVYIFVIGIGIINAVRMYKAVVK